MSYKVSGNNKTHNFTLLGDMELSASERTRRLIPYMAFYVPISELPINKQYINNNIHMTKQQQPLIRPPSATEDVTGGGAIGTTVSTHIPIPPHYIHSGSQYLAPSGPAIISTQSFAGGQNYHPNAGLGFYSTNSVYGGYAQPQSQYYLLPPKIGDSQHLQPPGPREPSNLGLPARAGINKANGNNAYVTFKEIKAPIRYKTVQYFPPLSTVSSAPNSLLSAIKHNSHGGSSDNSAGTAPHVYRPRTKQSKINLTPFTPSNTLPGNFVPIVYVPANTNNINYNSNNNLNSPTTTTEDSGVSKEIVVDSTLFNQQYREQQHQPQQNTIEYTSSVPLPPTASAISVPIDVSSPSTLSVYQSQHQQQQQQQHQQYHHNPKQQPQYFSVTTSPLSPVSVDLNHNVEAASRIVEGAALNKVHQLHPHHNTQTISPPATPIYHQREHIIIDAQLPALQKPQTAMVIGAKQQQQLYHNKSVVQFQPLKMENLFESELQTQRHQQQQHQSQHNIDQVLKDVNSYSIKSSHMMTPQEKYVMYLQQHVRHNKQQQQQQQQQQQYHEYSHNGSEQQQQQYINKQHQQQNTAQIFPLSSTIPPLDEAITAVSSASIGPSLQSKSPLQNYDSNYPKPNPIHYDLYPKFSSGNGGKYATNSERQKQILTIPVHSLINELETLQQQTHYSPTHSASQNHPSPHKSQYPKNGPATTQYNDYLIDISKQVLDDDNQDVIQSNQNHSQHHQQNQLQQLELLKPTLGPPSPAFILATTPAPFLQEPVTKKNYDSSFRPQYKTKPKIRLQPALKENNINYPIRQKNPTRRPQVTVIAHTAKTLTTKYNEKLSPKYVYMNDNFGKIIPTAQESTKLNPSNKYENNDNQIPQHWHSNRHHSQQQKNIPLKPLPQRQPIIHHVAMDSTSPKPPKTSSADLNELPDISTSSLVEILHKLQESNHLPHTLTPDNIDNSIKTLIRILNNLKQTQTVVDNPPQYHETPTHHTHTSSPDYDYTIGLEEEQHQQLQNISLLTPKKPNKHPGPSTGRPGIDYPNYAEIPKTSFDCSQQRYKGFFGDPETNCQVWHYCDLNGGKASFLCPNGTIFSQIALTCDWWFNVKCAATPQLYVLNERLYKYILPLTPKFPEDYSGPLVDKYLAMKFQEMEEKMRLEKEKKALYQETKAKNATERKQNMKTVSKDSKKNNHIDETTIEHNSHKHFKFDSTPTINHKHESANPQVSEQSSERNLLIDDEVANILQRGAADNFKSTTIATMTATTKSDAISFSLKPIIVSSTFEPDYDEDNLQHHESKRSHYKNIEYLIQAKTENETKQADSDDGDEIKISNSSTEMPSGNKVHITVEKVNVVEIKPDEATGHLIRNMLLNKK